MKAKGFIFLIPIFALMLVSVSGFKPGAVNEEFMQNPEGANLIIPEDVQTIIDNKCWGCHNPESQSDKAKKKLLWNELPDLSKSKIVSKLKDVYDEVDENKMPPEQFLAKHPDKALTQEESVRLKEWAKTTVDEMMK
jgi:hypothetical protein